MIYNNTGILNGANMKSFINRGNVAQQRINKILYVIFKVPLLYFFSMKKTQKENTGIYRYEIEIEIPEMNIDNRGKISFTGSSISNFRSNKKYFIYPKKYMAAGIKIDIMLKFSVNKFFVFLIISCMIKPSLYAKSVIQANKLLIELYQSDQ